MKKIFIHTGYPKTATSALQYFLHNNPELLKRHQLYYPQEGLALPERGHHNLVRSIPFCFHTKELYRPRLGNFKTLLKEISRKEEDIIISSEGFTPLFNRYPERTHQYLNKALKGCEMEYLIVVRKADEFIESNFFQRLNAWSRGRWKKRLPSIKTTKEQNLNGELVYLKMVEQTFDLGAKVTVFNYNSNIVTEVANYITKSSVTVPKALVNQRKTRKLLSLLYTLSNHARHAEYQELFFKNTAQILRTFAEHEKEKYGIFTPSECAQLVEKYTQKLEQINTKYDRKIAIPGEDKRERAFFLVNNFNDEQLKLIHSIFGLDVQKIIARELSEHLV